MIVLYNAVETDSNNMLQAGKQTAKLWLNLVKSVIQLSGFIKLL